LFPLFVFFEFDVKISLMDYYPNKNSVNQFNLSVKSN